MRTKTAQAAIKATKPIKSGNLLLSGKKANSGSKSQKNTQQGIVSKKAIFALLVKSRKIKSPISPQTPSTNESTNTCSSCIKLTTALREYKKNKNTLGNKNEDAP
jgi:hypothetical protein